MATPEEQKLRWKPMLLEAFFVVLGVVLALAANEWRQDYNQKKHAATALESVRHELTVNRAAILQSLTYHLQLTDTLRHLSSRSGPAGTGEPQYPNARLFSRGYLGPATLLNTAWQAANATDAVSAMGYADVLLLSQVYEDQRSYAYQAEQAGQLIYAKLFNEGHEGVRRNFANLNTLIAAFWYTECGLIAQYDKVLEQIERAPNPGAEEVPAICQRLPNRQ
jgi:hypothetical protein